MQSVRLFDAALKNAGVFFVPWIGPDYIKSGFKGRKLLILGESHYDEWAGKKHDLDRNFTRGCIEDVCLRDKDAAQFWRNLEQSLLNEQRVSGWPPSGGNNLWGKVAFYNFLQTPVSGSASGKPTREQFRDSWDAYRAVIESLRPDRVLVCGYRRLWEQMPPTPYDDDNRRKDVWYHDRIEAYVLREGKKSWCLAIKHPSRAFSWRGWHPVISTFLRQPSEAVSPLVSLLGK